MKLDVNVLLKFLWPGAVILVFSLFTFGTVLLPLVLKAVGLVYLIFAPFILSAVVTEDTEE